MRTIPTALQTHLDTGVTTTCRLLRIELPDGTSTGLTTHDRDITYNSVTYSAINGFDPSVIATDASFSVDNSEGYALVSGTLQGITPDMVRRGELEGATWEMLLINYSDLGMGHIVLDAGDVGEVKLVDDMVFIPELVSFAMRLRQTIGGVDSRTCRAIFGKPANSQIGCGVDADALWVSGTVSAVDSEEPKRIFTADVSQAIPARIQWLTGNNASSKLYQVDTVDTTNHITRSFEPLPFPIEVGDTFQVRPDCDKTLATCRDTYSNMINFKGEPLIPIGEASDVPNANIS